MTAAAFVRALRLAAKHVAALQETYPSHLDTEDLADTIAVVQDLRARLGMVEADLTRDLGQAVGKNYVGYLSDGRQYEVKRGGDRTAWDHDDWKRDVRRNVTAQVLKDRGLPEVADLVDDDGQMLEVHLASMLQEAVTAAQEVHGSTAPKSTSLKALGLYAGDYSTTTPGPWRFSAAKPTTTTDSPNQEK